MVLLLLGLSGMTAMMGETTARDVRRSASVDGVQGQVRQQRQRRSDSRSDSGSDEGSYSESDRDDASDDSSSNSNSNDDDSVSYASTSLSSMDSEDDVSTGISPTLSGENPTTTASPIECDEIEAESTLREFLQDNIPADGITDFAKDFTVDFNLQSLPEGEELLNVIVINNTDITNIPGLISNFNTLRKIVSSPCVVRLFGNFSVDLDELCTAVASGNLNDITLLRSQVSDLRDDFLGIMDLVLGSEITDETRNATRDLFDVAVFGALLAKLQCLRGDIDVIIDCIINENNTQLAPDAYISKLFVFFEGDNEVFVQFEPALDLYLFTILNISPDNFNLFDDDDVIERLRIYAQELIAVQQDVCQVALSAEEISIIKAYYVGPLAHYISNTTIDV